MNDLLNRPIVDPSTLTPIEIALGIDIDGMTQKECCMNF